MSHSHKSLIFREISLQSLGGCDAPLSLVSYPEHYSQVSEKDKSHVFGVISKNVFQNILVGPFLHTAAMAKTLSSGRKTNVKKEIVFIVSIDIIESNKYVTNNYFAICNSGAVCT